MMLVLQIEHMAQSATSDGGRMVQEFPKMTSPTVLFFFFQTEFWDNFLSCLSSCSVCECLFQWLFPKSVLFVKLMFLMEPLVSDGIQSTSSISSSGASVDMCYVICLGSSLHSCEVTSVQALVIEAVMKAVVSHAKQNQQTALSTLTSSGNLRYSSFHITAPHCN